ncbi:hypothetical protein Tco_0242118, partial [Tanacetum coccineum]
FEEEKARKHKKVFNWETAKYGRIWYDEDVHDLRSIENEFLAIAFNDSLKSGETLSCEPTVSSLNDEIEFKISFDDSDDENYTENDNEKVNMPSFLPPEPTVNCFDDLDFFKDFENEFPAIVYNNAQTSKSNLLTELILSPQHVDEFNLKDETSLSECDEEEQNVLNFNDLFPFNVIYPNDSKSDKDNDDNKVDIKQPSRGNVINFDVGAYAHSTVYMAYSLNEYNIFNTGINTAYPGVWIRRTILGPRERKSTNIGGEFTNLKILKCWSLETSRRLFNTHSCLIKLNMENLPSMAPLPPRDQRHIWLCYQKCKNMKRSQDMQLIQKLRDDQKRMKKVFEVMSGRSTQRIDYSLIQIDDVEYCIKWKIGKYVKYVKYGMIGKLTGMDIKKKTKSDETEHGSEKSVRKQIQWCPRILLDQPELVIRVGVHVSFYVRVYAEAEWRFQFIDVVERKWDGDTVNYVVSWRRHYGDTWVLEVEGKVMFCDRGESWFVCGCAGGFGEADREIGDSDDVEGEREFERCGGIGEVRDRNGQAHELDGVDGLYGVGVGVDGRLRLGQDYVRTVCRKMCNFGECESTELGIGQGGERKKMTRVGSQLSMSVRALSDTAQYQASEVMREWIQLCKLDVVCVMSIEYTSLSSVRICYVVRVLDGDVELKKSLRVVEMWTQVMGSDIGGDVGRHCGCRVGVQDTRERVDKAMVDSDIDYGFVMYKCLRMISLYCGVDEVTGCTGCVKIVAIQEVYNTIWSVSLNSVRRFEIGGCMRKRCLRRCNVLCEIRQILRVVCHDKVEYSMEHRSIDGSHTAHLRSIGRLRERWTSVIELQAAAIVLVSDRSACTGTGSTTY